MSTVLLVIALAAIEAQAAEQAVVPGCAMQIARLQILIPERGATWLSADESTNCCNIALTAEWSRLSAGANDLLVYADGPSGSGRIWTAMVGLAEGRGEGPVRGLCLQTSTVGWRTLRQFARTPLPWLDDADQDGRPELILWDSFALNDQASLAEFGLVAWVYELQDEHSLQIEWDLTRRMAGELAEAYEQPIDEQLGVGADLRKTAAQSLRALATQSCRVTPAHTR